MGRIIIVFDALPAMRFLYFILVAILLSACVSQEAPEPASPVAEQKEEAEIVQDKVDTSNLTVAPTETDVLTADTVFPEPPVFDFTNKTTTDGRLIVYYFKSTGCIASKELQPEIDRLQAEYPEIEWHTYDIITQNGTLAYNQFAEMHNLSTEKRLVPQALVNGTIITDRFNINETLEGVIAGFEGS